MNTYSARRPPTFDWAKALLVSVMVHVALILLWIGAILLEIFSIEVREFVEEVIPEESYASMPVEMIEAFEQSRAELPAEETQPKPPQKSFLDTQPNQETTEAVKSERYFGERNTAAANSGDIAEEGLEVPSQEGREARTATDMELTNSDFADGDTEGAPGTPGEPLPLSANSPTAATLPEEEMTPDLPPEESEPAEETPFLEPEELIEPPNPTSEERIDSAKAKAAELLALEESIPVAKKEEEEEPQKEPEVEESIPEPKPDTKPPAQHAAGGTSGDRGLDGGFDREAKRTRMTGTIRRRGESSLDVEDSVKGRYFAQVNKEIEKAWQRECILRREHILPGVLSVSFVMNDTGKVTGFRFDSRIAGGAIQEGFTMRAIQKAKLPPMPEEIKGELDGNQLEMNLTFFF